MATITTLEQAFSFASILHKNHFRRGGEPYFNHLKRVWNRVEQESLECQMAAIFHDSIEDDKISEYDLEKWIPKESFEAVLLLTKRDGQNYADYLKSIRGNQIATKVKIADMLDNISDSPTPAQIVKYAKGLLMLVSV